MDNRQVRLVNGTLRAALLDAAIHAGEAELGAAFVSAAKGLSSTNESLISPHPRAPKVGGSTALELQVGDADTAAAMGHPDGRVAVLASPRLALWFELASSALLGQLEEELTHLGTGILVHHLSKAHVGEKVNVKAEVHEVEGRRVVFRCEARVGERLVAFGVHERVLLNEDSL